MRRVPIFGALLLATVLAAGNESPAAGEPVIPPGQDDLLAAMLGTGATLPGDCKLAGGQVHYATVNATYTCPGGQVVVELAHRNTAGWTGAHTAKFAIRLLSGSPPPDLLTAFESRIRSHEATFEWKSFDPPSTRSSPRIVALAVAGLLGILLLGWAARRFTAATRYGTASGPSLTGRFAARLYSAAGQGASRIRWRLRGALSGLALALAAVFMGLVISEVAVRRTGSDQRAMTSVLLFQQSNWEVHRVSDDWFLHYDLRPGAHLENVGYWGNPYHMNIDEFGARAPAHPGRKRPGVFRILCFGGSTMYGADVSDEETIPAALERRLDAEAAESAGATPPRHFEAWNFGTHAYVLSQAAHRARRELVVRDPDLILVQLHNVGPRAFFLERDAQQSATLQRYAMDPYVIPENFPPPTLVPSLLHFAALRYSAAYRLVAGLLRRRDRTDSPFAEQLSREDARALSREGEARHVPVVFLSIPCDGSGPGPSSAYPELPEDHFINFYEPGHEPDYYMMHPPARFLDEYAGQLIKVLRQRGYLPPNSYQ